ncbi:MAG TPA: CsgE family curli-type amyloid fiber assembly protein [Flavobacterium sp.]|nr:CsgE family curli-type amyloid fiber assembly protein [Flavobacterium sp.]
MNSLKPFLLLCILFSALTNAQEVRDSLIVAKIEVTQSEDVLTFRPTVQNNGIYHYQLDYLLLVKKNDTNNNLSINQQKGKFTLEPNEIKSLGTTTVNQAQHQSITAIVFIRDEIENRLITKDSIQIITKDLIPVTEASLTLMRGIVVDDSRTKLGRDYYDLFYSTYNQYPTKFDFVIHITEMPYRGLSSILQVKVDQELIYEFFTNPDEEYIRQQVFATMQKLVVYANRKDKLKNEFIY